MVYVVVLRFVFFLGDTFLVLLFYFYSLFSRVFFWFWFVFHVVLVIILFLAFLKGLLDFFLGC